MDYEKILKKQRKIYQGNKMEKEENNENIKMINISELSNEDLEKTCFHFSLKKDKNSIDRNGLETKIGRNSKGIDQLSSIYFSYGLEGALETWDVWLKWRLNRLYNPYFKEENKGIQQTIKNRKATEEEKYDYYYKCKQWEEEFTNGEYKEDKEKLNFLYEFHIDEMLASNYYILDLKEGEDFSFDEVDVKKQYKLNFKDEPDQMFKQMYGKYSNFESAKVDKWNMNTFLGKQMTIEPDRIKQLVVANGKNDVLSVIEFLYDKYKEITPKEKQVQFDLLDRYMEYVKDKIKNNELQEFDRNDRINESSLLFHFHDQKSDVFFEDRASGVYSIPEHTNTSNQTRLEGENSKGQVSEHSFTIGTGVMESAKKIASKEIERNVKKGSSEIKSTYKEFESPIPEIDNNKNLED